MNVSRNFNIQKRDDLNRLSNMVEVMQTPHSLSEMYQSDVIQCRLNKKVVHSIYYTNKKGVKSMILSTGIADIKMTKSGNIITVYATPQLEHKYTSIRPESEELHIVWSNFNTCQYAKVYSRCGEQGEMIGFNVMVPVSETDSSSNTHS